jgi:hypothetical protein
MRNIICWFMGHKWFVDVRFERIHFGYCVHCGIDKAKFIGSEYTSTFNPVTPASGREEE